MNARAIGFMALLAATACSGTPQDAALAPHGGTARTASVTIRVAVPKATTSSHRAPAFVSSAVQSISVGVSAAGATAAPAQTGNCSNGTCAETVDAPIGTDTFAVALYDARNGGGNLLANGIASAAVAAGTNTSVVVTFDPVVATAEVSYFDTLEAGTAGTTTGTLYASDPGGALIMAPGAFEHPDGSPLTLSIALVDPSGATHVTLGGATSQSSPATAASPAPLTIAYDGAPVNFDYPSIVVSDASSKKPFASNAVQILPHATGAAVPLVGGAFSITSTAIDGRGALWFTAAAPNPAAAEYGRYVPSTGAVTTYALPNPAASPDSLVAAADGDVYFFEHGTTTFGQISPGGTLREFPYTADVSIMTLGVDGRPWFAAQPSNQADIGNISTSGTVTAYAAPAALGLTAGPNGDMWFVYSGVAGGTMSFELQSIAPDGTFGTPVPIPSLGIPMQTSVGGLHYAPDGDFYTQARQTDVPSASLAYSVTTGGAAAPTCAFGDFKTALSDGTLLYSVVDRSVRGFYSAIRADGTCVASSGSFPALPPVSQFVEPVSTGHAYGITSTAITPFAY